MLTYNYSSVSSSLRTVNGSGLDIFYRDEIDSFDIALSVSSFDHDGLGNIYYVNMYCMSNDEYICTTRLIIHSFWYS